MVVFAISMFIEQAINCLGKILYLSLVLWEPGGACFTCPDHITSPSPNGAIYDTKTSNVLPTTAVYPWLTSLLSNYNRFIYIWH